MSPHRPHAIVVRFSDSVYQELIKLRHKSERHELTNRDLLMEDLVNGIVVGYVETLQFSQQREQARSI